MAWICKFFLPFFIEISQQFHPKCAPDRSISISKMHKLPRVGGGTVGGGHPPPTPSPRSGASRPRLLFPSNILDNLAPPPGKTSCVRPCLQLEMVSGGIIQKRVILLWTNAPNDALAHNYCYCHAYLSSSRFNFLPLVRSQQWRS